MSSNPLDACRCPKDYVPHSLLGFVMDTEQVARIVSSSHIGAKGVKASVISNSQLKDSGVSLFRMGFLAKAQFDTLASAVSASIPPGTNTTAGVILASAANLRQFLDKFDKPGLCLYDDPTDSTDTVPENPAHAIAVAAEQYADDEIIRIKTELMRSVFGQLVPLDKLDHSKP